MDLSKNKNIFKMRPYATQGNGQGQGGKAPRGKVQEEAAREEALRRALKALKKKQDRTRAKLRQLQRVCFPQPTMHGEFGEINVPSRREKIAQSRSLS